MSTNLMQAANQYANRPKDERFSTINDLITSAQYDKDHSKTITYNAKDLHATVKHDQPEPRLMLESPRGVAEFTHWSFGQLARTIKAPAGYLRSLPPQVAADCMNFGLKSTVPGTDINLLVKANGGVPVVRAATSETYGRVWDSTLFSGLRDTILKNGKFLDGLPTWSGEKAGWYRGDRDSFGITVDGGSIVEDPSLIAQASGNSKMFRGIMISNSEVGSRAITIDTIYFRYVCGNHIIWSAIFDKRFRRRHVGENAGRDALREIYSIAYRWTNSGADRDQQIIKGLIENELAHTKDAVIDELRKLGASKEQAEQAYETCEKTESASPRSFWGLAQGMTRNSQDENGWQDERMNLDQLAAKLLQMGTKRQLVTV